MNRWIESFDVEIHGTRPLLMHHISGLGENKGRSAKYDSQEDAEAALYKSTNGEIIVPAINLLSCLRMAGVDFKVPGKGRRTYKNYIYSGIEISPADIPLTHGGYEIDIRPVTIQKARILRSRPRFDEWSLRFQLDILDPIITNNAVKEIMYSAGRFIGLCDFRPLFGLFEITKFEVIQ